MKALKSTNEPPAEFKDRAKIETGLNEHDIPFSKLMIMKTDVSDRMIYICQVSLSAGCLCVTWPLTSIFQAKLKNAAPFEDCEASKECDESEVILRVKDPMAALWPFIGIVAEVCYFLTSPQEAIQNFLQ